MIGAGGKILCMVGSSRSYLPRNLQVL